MFEQSKQSEKSLFSGPKQSKKKELPDTERLLKQLKMMASGPIQMFVQDEEEEKVQRKSQEDEELQKKNAPTSPGSKTEMPEDVKSKMENSFGTDFSDVNI